LRDDQQSLSPDRNRQFWQLFPSEFSIPNAAVRKAGDNKNTQRIRRNIDDIDDINAKAAARISAVGAKRTALFLWRRYLRKYSLFEPIM
jgi:DNA-binding helix-hairpin-helix protein with protein kinase domain